MGVSQILIAGVMQVFVLVSVYQDSVSLTILYRATTIWVSRVCLLRVYPVRVAVKGKLEGITVLRSPQFHILFNQRLHVFRQHSSDLSACLSALCLAISHIGPNK